VGSALISVGLPVGLVVVMLGLGLSLTVDDFRRVGRHPKAAVIALLCQLVLLPVICFGLVLGFGLSPELALGMMLLAATPGGPTANLYSHLFGGLVALSLTLTAINTAFIVVTLPIVVNLSAGYFMPDQAAIGLQFDKVLQVLTYVLGPVVVGMVLRAWAPGVARRLDRPVRVLSIVMLVVLIGLVVHGAWDSLADNLAAVGLAALTFNVVSLAVGYGAPRVAGVDHREAVAAGFEIGVHNASVSVTIALSPALLNSAEIAVPSVVYGVLAHVTAITFGWVMSRRRKAVSRAEPRVGSA
jgi:BASS family bile acid:Na+ symporter